MQIFIFETVYLYIVKYYFKFILCSITKLTTGIYLNILCIGLSYIKKFYYICRGGKGHRIKMRMKVSVSSSVL